MRETIDPERTLPICKLKMQSSLYWKQDSLSALLASAPELAIAVTLVSI